MRVQSAFAYVVITLYDRLFQAVRLAAGLVTLWFYTDARPTTTSPPYWVIASSGHWVIEKPLRFYNDSMTQWHNMEG